MKNNKTEIYENDVPGAEPFQTSYKNINLMSIMLAILKRPWFIFLSLLIVMMPLIYYVLTIVPVYKSSSTVMVQVKGVSFLSSISLDGHSTSSARTMKYYTSILDSRAFRNAVEEYIFRHANYMPEDSLREVFANSFNRYTTNPREIGFLTIYANSVDEHFALLLAQVALEIFKERSIELERQEAQDVLDFIDTQLAQLNIKMERAENNLQTFLSERKLLIEDMEIGVSKQLFDLEKKLSESQANYEMVQINIKSYEEKINDLLDKLTAGHSQKDDKLVTELRGRLNYIKEELDNPAASNLSSAEIHALYSEMNQIRSDLVGTLSKTTSNERKSGENTRITLQKLEEVLEKAFLEREKFKNQMSFNHIQLNRFKTEHTNLSKDVLDFASLSRSKDVLEKTIDILLEKREESRIRVASEHGGIKVIDEPQLPKSPISTKKMQKLLLGLLASLGFGVLISVIVDRFDDTIKDENDINQYLGLAVFGTLPVMSSNSKSAIFMPVHKTTKKKSDSNDDKKLLIDYSEKSPVAEAYRSLKTSIQFIAQDKSKKIFVITSPGASEGKSLISMNLGISFAQGGQRTLVIDCDLRRPVQHKYFKFDRKPGLSNLLFGEVEVKDIVRQTTVPNLFLITAGTSPPNPAEMVASRKMKNFLKDIREQYDIIIIDSPPIMACVDSRIMSQSTDGMIIITKVESTKIHDLEHVVNLSRRLDVDILGVILNQVEFRYGYTYYYAYRYYNPYSYYYGSYNYYYYYSSDREEKVRKRGKSKSARKRD